MNYEGLFECVFQFRNIRENITFGYIDSFNIQIRNSSYFQRHRFHPQRFEIIELWTEASWMIVKQMFECELHSVKWQKCNAHSFFCTRSNLFIGFVLLRQPNRFDPLLNRLTMMEITSSMGSRRKLQQKE